MSWYSKPASRWWEESSEKKWHDRESSRSLAKAWNSEGHETWNGQSRGKDDWKALGEWAQSKTKTKGDFRASPGDWSGKVKAWKSEKIEKLQRHQWVAKSDKQLESDKPPSMDPAVALEGALADVEELLGERLDSTRELLEDSHRSAMEAVRLATLALELLTRKAVDCKNEEDLNNVMRAKQSVRELLMWRNFGLKTWLHNKPDPMNFQRYDAEVQNELRQTFTKIEQNLLQELVAGDSWSKLARKLRFCVGNQGFSREMRTLLTRIISTQGPQAANVSSSWTFLSGAFVTAGGVAAARSRKATTRAVAGPAPLKTMTRPCRVARRAVEVGDIGSMAQLVVDDPQVAVTAMHAASQTASEAMAQLMTLLGPVQPAAAFDLAETGSKTWESIAGFFFDPRLQWDENGNVLLDPQGNPLPDNLWTQFVAFQATLIKRLDETISGLGIPQSFGFAVATYTLLIRALLYPFVKGQLETTAKIQILAPRVNELREKYKDDEERLQQEVGLLYMDLQVDPLGAVVPLLVQLPVFWGLYRAIRRLAIVEYPHLKDGFLWIPSLYGPNFRPDPSFDWIMNWEGPLINLHPKIGWSEFSLYAILPVAIFLSYRSVMSEALEDENAPKLLQFTPFLLSGITIELPQAMGIYIAANIASSFALTSYTKNQISSQIPGYEEFVKTGEWPEGVDGEKVLEKAFGVKRLTAEAQQDPQSVPEAVFAGRADHIPTLLKNGRKIDEFDDKGIPASMYTLALNNSKMLEQLLELGADPRVVDKRGNNLLHYASGYGRAEFLPFLLDKGLKDLLDETNEDGQTPLDVARLNLSQAKTADAVRPVIAQLKEVGAKGKVTSDDDEARFEKAREDMIQEEQVKKARSALKALAMAAQKQEHDAQPVEAPEHPDGDLLDQRVKSPLNASLERVRSLNLDELRERLGGKMSEEQLEKLSRRLSTMSPEDLAKFAAGLPSVKAEKEKKEAASREEERTRESVIVD